MRAAAVALVGVVVCGLGAPRVLAHTRERDRIAALELAQEKRNALLTQSVKEALDGAARLEESIKERAEHARHLSGQIEALRSDVTSGLGSVVGSVSAAIAPPLQALEGRLERRIREQAETEARRRAEAVDPLRTGLDGLAVTQAREALAIRAELDELRTSMKGFRTYLQQFNENLEARLGKLSGDVARLESQRVKDQAANGKRIEALLQAVSEENLKLRRGLQELAGGEAAPASGAHVVQKGESLYGIARKYGVELEALEAANPELTKPGAVVHPGMKVRIPGR